MYITKYVHIFILFNILETEKYWNIKILKDVVFVEFDFNQVLYKWISGGCLIDEVGGEKGIVVF